MTKRTTIKDIASAAKVSSATVSYILNEVPNKSISDETRQMVLSLAQQMNYIPNNSARRLKTNHANCIAVRLSQTLMLPRYHTILQGLRSYLTPKGYSILLASDDKQGSFSGCMYACMSGQADGVIYISSNGTGISQEEFDQVQKQSIPISVIDCMGDRTNVNSITYDYYASSSLRMEYLLKNGYKKFLYLRPAYQDAKEVAREQGVRSASLIHKDVSVEVHQMQTINEEWRHADFDQFASSFHCYTVQEAKKVLRDVDPDTAVVAYSRELQDVVLHILYADHLLHNCPETEQWNRRGVSYHFPHFDAGVEAAASLLNTISGSKDVRRLSLQPILDITDPDLF